MKQKQVKQKLMKHVFNILLCVTLLSGSVFSEVPVYAAQIPAKVKIKSGIDIESNAKASVDLSNLSEGFISAKYKGGKNVKIKLQIAKASGTTYTYNLNNKGNTETFALTDGNGKYSIKIFENTSGTKYAQAFSYSLTLALDNNFSPFLYPNQYVNFTNSSKVVSKAAELVKRKNSSIDKVTAIYTYVIDTFVYDTKRAETVTSGYLPVVDNVLAAKKGICFDYASVMAAMLRSQNIPCKLIVGYAGTVYHAWLNVYLEGKGWVEKVIYFDGKNWTLMDPTFASNGNSSPKIMKYISNGSNYTKKFAY